MRLEIRANGVPKGQPRGRACIRGGHASTYNPDTAEGWKGCVALAAMGKIPAEPIEGAVWVEMVFYMPRPKSHLRTGKRAGELRPSAPRFHISTPDIDNLEKAVLDVLTGVRFYRDDSQVVDCHCSKVYETAEHPQGARIEIHTDLEVTDGPHPETT